MTNFLVGWVSSPVLCIYTISKNICNTEIGCRDVPVERLYSCGGTSLLMYLYQVFREMVLGRAGCPPHKIDNIK
ncbi:hypothetical protein JYQ62_32790 [Nostoc sp. UHCC 0702]|nr:hypothetical protein JYQ62_32790 [Nostoc sp. UHCC 0702]